MSEDVIAPSRHGVARAISSSWRYSWEGCPWGAKMLLLTSAGVAVIGSLPGKSHGYLAWAPLPDRDRAKEKEIGL